ncbi:hypothetical protein [Endothiovibrio diazotrophicus]
MKRALIGWAKDAVHNCLVHPLMPWLPRRWGDALHRANAEWAYGSEGEQ